MAAGLPLHSVGDEDSGVPERPSAVRNRLDVPLSRMHEPKLDRFGERVVIGHEAGLPRSVTTTSVSSANWAFAAESWFADPSRKRFP
jgi:hypothetical protein